MFTAWHTALFTRQKKMQPLRNILDRMEGKPIQPATPDQLRVKVMALHAAFGGNRNG